MSSSAPAENAHESQIDVVIATPEIEGEGGPSKEREKRTSKHDNRGSTSKEDMEKPLPKEPKKESSRSQGKESANASTGSEESRSKKKSKQRAREEPSDVRDLVVECPWTGYEMSIRNLEVHFDRLRNLPSLYSQLGELAEENEKLRALQGDMLSGIDRFHPTPDSAIQEKVKSLRNLIRVYAKGFSKQLRDIKEGPSIQDRLQGRVLTTFIEDSIWADSRNVLSLVESVIWKKILDTVFRSPFQVFGEQLEGTWKAIFDEEGKESPDAYPTASEQSEKWRNATILHLTTKVVEKNPERATAIATTILEQLEDRLTSILAIDQLKSSDREALRKIVMESCEFAVLLGQQRCRLRFYEPEAGALFDTADNGREKLDPLGDEDIQFGTVAFVSAPGLRKWGNGYGQNLEEVDVIVGAKVKVVELPA